MDIYARSEFHCSLLSEFSHVYHQNYIISVLDALTIYLMICMLFAEAVKNFAKPFDISLIEVRVYLVSFTELEIAHI